MTDEKVFGYITLNCKFVECETSESVPIITNIYKSLQINVHSECNLCNECLIPIIFTVFLQLSIYLYIDCDLMNFTQSIKRI